MVKLLKYDAGSIDVNLGLDAVRNAPQIYISSPDSDGILHILNEAIDNAVDEAKQNAVKDKRVGIIIDPVYFWVYDFGRGIPVEKHAKTKISTLTTIMTTLSAGGKMREGKDASYEKTGGIHGVGISVTNALSNSLEVWTHRSGKWYYQKFLCGHPTKTTQPPIIQPPPALPFIGKKAQPYQGTIIKFTPDYSLFDHGSRLPVKKLRESMQLRAYLHPQLQFILAQPDKLREYHQPQGLSALIEKHRQKLAATANGKVFEFHDENLDVALMWSTAVDEHLTSFVNGVINTRDGGSHVQGSNQAIVDALAPFKGKRAKYRAEDLRAGLIGALNVKISKPRFTNQTKEKLGMPEVTDTVKRSLTAPLAKFFQSNKSLAREIIRRAGEQHKANVEFKLGKKAAAEIRTNKGGRTFMPAKLANALSNNPLERELFLVEGDSAGGTAKEARDRQFQAVLPLFGKMLNVIRAPDSKIAANVPVRDVLQAIGYDPTKRDPFGNLQYGKIIFLADADPDGEHINLLLAGVFQKIMRPLIEAGRVYVGDSPLFTAQVGAKRFYAASKQELEQQLPKNRTGVFVTRVKGLGELNPEQLREVAFEPTTRKLKRLMPVKNRRLQRFYDVLGSDTQFRKDLLKVGGNSRAGGTVK